MANFAELDSNNVVLRVIVVNDENTLDENGDPSEACGIAFCTNLLGGRWIQTSYNTFANTHILGGTPFRKNFAGVGHSYDAQRDAFIAPRPVGDEYIFDEDKCIWYDPLYEPITIGVERV